MSKKQDDLTAKELAAEAGVDPGYIRQLLGKKRLQGRKRGGAWFISIEEARRWLEQRNKKSRSGT